MLIDVSTQMKPRQGKDSDPKYGPDYERQIREVERNQEYERNRNEEEKRKSSALLNSNIENLSHYESDELPPPGCLQRYFVDHQIVWVLLLDVELDQREWRWQGTPRMALTESQLQILLGENSYAGMPGHLLLCGQAHHRLSSLVASKEDVSH